MLASTACAEARIAGMNLFNVNVVKTFSRTIAIYSTAISNTGFGTAGVMEQRAKLEGIAAVTGLFEGMNRHPGNLPDAHKQIVKLIAAKSNENSGTGLGRGHGTGGGRGKNKGGAFGTGGNCICAKCGTKVSHQQGVKCTTIKCTDCGHTMIREELLNEKRRKD